MWLMTSFGILMPAIRPPKTVAFGDDRTMQIRARRARDLDILRAEYMQGKLGPTLHTADKDYEYRAYCTPESFAVAMMRAIIGIDYLKFKPTTVDRYEDQELHGTYNRIWSVVSGELSTLQHRTNYWHSAGKPPPRGINLAKKTTQAGTGWAEYGERFTGDAGDVGAIVALHTAAAYDTSADRDTYEPEPWDDQAPSQTGDPVLDEVYAEIEDLEFQLAERLPIDHTFCQHNQSSNARDRCRRKRRRDWTVRLVALRRRVDERYAAIAEKFREKDGPSAESSRSVTVVAGDVVAEQKETTP